MVSLAPTCPADWNVGGIVAVSQGYDTTTKGDQGPCLRVILGLGRIFDRVMRCGDHYFIPLGPRKHSQPDNWPPRVPRSIVNVARKQFELVTA